MLDIENKIGLVICSMAEECENFDCLHEITHNKISTCEKSTCHYQSQENHEVVVWCMFDDSEREDFKKIADYRKNTTENDDGENEDS